MDIRDRHFDPMTAEEWIRCISSNDFTPYELAWIYCCAMEWCGLLTDPENLTAVTKAMLDHGMDPNELVTEELPSENREENFYHIPLISVTRYEDNPAAAESLSLLFEHGGDPNTRYGFEGSDGEYDENVFQFYVDDEFVNGPDLGPNSFYGLLLSVAYGGKNCNGFDPLTMLIGAPRSIMKDYTRYWYEYEDHGNYSSTLYFIEKETGIRVARFF